MSTDLVPLTEYRALTAPPELFHGAVEQLVDQDVGEFDLTRIRIPSGGGTTWEIPGARGATSTRELQGVVLFAKASRAYWPGAYEGNNDPPVCASRDGRTASARPVETTDPETKEVTEAMPRIPAETDPSGRYICDTCHFAEFGSGDGRRQACKQMRQIFLLLPDRLLPAVLTLPPTSLKAAKVYFLGLVDLGLLQHGVITRATLHKQKNEGTPEFSVVEFQAGDELPPELAARALAYSEAARPRFMRVVATREDLGEEPASAPVDATVEPEA